jgi:PAS domain S-box-containing protein
MTEYRFDQLVDLDRVRSLLKVHHKITGVCTGILDPEQNILVGEGWEDICTRFHRVHPVTCARCLESNEFITHGLQEEEEGCRACKCENGLWDIAMPIIIDGRMVATFFIGQFFYDDDEVDEAFFRAQAAEFGFDEEAYLAALRKVPVFTREQIRNILDFYRALIQILAESGLKKLGLMREVEEREKAEKAQQASKDFLEKIINSISDPMFVKDRQHRLVLVNDAECALAGCSREEMLGRTDYDFFPREQVDVFWEKDDLVLETGEENINEEEITDARGEKRIIVTKKNLYTDPRGEKYLVGIIRDITDRKMASEQLALLNFALNNVHEAACLIDHQARFLFVNDEASLALGYKREELLDLTLHDVDPDYPKERFPDIWREFKECGSLTFEVFHRKKDGKSFPAEVNANYFEYAGAGYILALARDITERKQSEERLRESETRMRMTLEASQIGIFDWDVANDRWQASPTYYSMLGYEPKDGPGDRNEWLERVHPDDRPDVGEKIREALEHKSENYEYEARLRHADGTYRWQQIRGFRLGHDESGRTTRILGVRTDITERKQAEQQLRQALDFAEGVVNAIPDILFEVDREGRYLNVWTKYPELLAAPKEALLGRTVREILSPENAAIAMEGLREAEEKGISFGNILCIDLPQGRRWFEISMSLKPGSDPSDIRFLVLSRDVTERVQMEVEVKESEARYRDVFENASDALYLVEVREDGRFRIIEANPALAEATGIAREDHVGRFVEETLSGEGAYALVDTFRRCVEAGTAIDEETVLDVPTGKRTFHSTLIPVRDDSGRIHRIAGISRDITDRKRAEELLRKRIELEIRLAKLAEVSPGAMYSYQELPDGTARMIYASPRFESVTRFQPQELATDISVLTAAIHPDDIEAHLESIAESGRTLRPWQNEFRIHHPDKGWIWVEGRSAPERQEDGSTIWYGFLHDITARKRRQAQEEVRLRIFEGLAQGSELAEILKLVVEYVELVNADFIGNIMLADAEGKFLRPVCSLGLPEEYLAAVKKVRIGEGIGSCGTAAWRGETVIASNLCTHPFWTPYNQPALQAGLLSCWSEPIFGASGKVLGTISIYRRQPGEPSEMELELVRRACHLVAVAIERKRALDQLHEREQAFRALAENSPDNMARYDSEYRRIYINPAMQRRFGRPESEILGKKPYELSPLPKPFEYVQMLREAWESGREVRKEMTFRNAEGAIRWEDMRVVPEFAPNGTVASVLAIGRDITEHKQAEQALQESERRYRSLFEESIDGVFLSSRPGKMFDISKSGVKMFGYDSKEEMLTLDLARDVYVNPEEREEVLAAVEEKGFYEFETLFKKKNGDKMQVHCVVSSMKDGGGATVYQGVLRDVTQQKQMEQELFKAKKLEIIGQLAGGVAHEVRNPLNALLSISEALFREKEIAENPEYEPYIQHIRTQVGRLSKLMSDLLDLGKPIKPENIHPVSLYEVLTDTISLWTATDLARKCRLTFTCDRQDSDCLVTADPIRLQQALLNILDNAAQHSMKDGSLSLHVDEPVGGRVSILIRDAGKGIPPVNLEKVFEPFFTTRTGGTGLGLPLVKHIVESMGGEVRLFNNDPSPGCTAELKLRVERRKEKKP